ncbi:MAG: trigger factor [Candidatus Margulisiibacteriota bacterium]
MKINSQKREGNKVFFEIEEDPAKLKEIFEKTLVEAGKEIKISGFRPGKAPRGMVERAIDPEAVNYRATQNVISEIYPKLIEETKIEPVDYPNIDIVSNEKDKPLVFKLSVEVYPEVKLGKYIGIKAERKSTEVKEEEIIHTLGRLQERFSATNAEGKKELLALDDEFAKKVSRYGTLEELKEELKTALKNEKTAESDADVKNKLIGLVAADTDVEIPSSMTEREIEIMFDELKTSLSQSGLTIDDYLKGAKKEEKSLRDEMRKSAEIRVKGKVILRAIAEKEGLKVEEETIRDEIKAMAGETGQDIDAIMKKLEKGTRSYMEEYLLRKKALEFLLEKANIKVEEEKKG